MPKKRKIAARSQRASRSRPKAKARPKGPPPRKTRPRRPSASEAVRQSLGECAARAVPARLVFDSLELSFQSRFAQVKGSRVLFEVMASVSRGSWLEPPAGVACCVSFVHNGRACVFLSTLESYQPPGKDRALPRIALALPPQVAHVELRQSVRVPVGDNAPLRVTAQTRSGQTFHALPIDISLHGMFLDVFASEDPQLPEGAELQISLQLLDLHATLTAVVRRRQGSRYGLAFSGPAGAPFEPPAAFRELITKLERLWVENLLD
jgi:c-di-GMP-binding flagellar brake protein YcgR